MLSDPLKYENFAITTNIRTIFYKNAHSNNLSSEANNLLIRCSAHIKQNITINTHVGTLLIPLIKPGLQLGAIIYNSETLDLKLKMLFYAGMEYRTIGNLSNKDTAPHYRSSNYNFYLAPEYRFVISKFVCDIYLGLLFKQHNLKQKEIRATLINPPKKTSIQTPYAPLLLENNFYKEEKNSIPTNKSDNIKNDWIEKNLATNNQNSYKEYNSIENNPIKAHYQENLTTTAEAKNNFVSFRPDISFPILLFKKEGSSVNFLAGVRANLNLNSVKKLK